MWYYTCILNFLGLKLCPADLLSKNPTPETLKKIGSADSLSTFL